METNSHLFQDECIFCQEYREGIFFNGSGGYVDSLQIFETENFWVKPSLGCFTEGYILIISKYHHDGVGRLTPKLCSELEKLLQKLDPIIQEKYGDYITYEHGDGIFSCQCISHLHIHIIPLKSTILASIRESLEEDTLEYQEYEFDSLKDVAKLRESSSYLLYRSNYLEWHLFTYQNKIPSQYIRQLAAEVLGIPEKYNWREYPMFENSIKTYVNLQSLLK